MLFVLVCKTSSFLQQHNEISTPGTEKCAKNYFIYLFVTVLLRINQSFSLGKYIRHEKSGTNCNICRFYLKLDHCNEGHSAILS